MFLIRPVKKEEIIALLEIAGHTFRIAWEHMNDPEDFEVYCQQKFSVPALLAEMAELGSDFYFVESAGDLAAYFKLNTDWYPDDWPETGKAVQLERIYVLPEFQGQGIGAEILAFSEKIAQAHRFDWVWLSVWEESPRSKQFYLQNGYEVFGKEPFVLGKDIQTDWLMRKKISGINGNPALLAEQPTGTKKDRGEVHAE